MKGIFRASPEEKKKIISGIISVLERENCTAAILFGSFVKNEDFHDIDLCVAHSGGQEPPSREDRLKDILTREVGFSFDIIYNLVVIAIFRHHAEYLLLTPG